MTFGSSESKLELDQWMLNRGLSLQFKTSYPDGIIAFTGTESTYLSLELIDGSLVFTAQKSEFTFQNALVLFCIYYERFFSQFITIMLIRFILLSLINH